MWDAAFYRCAEKRGREDVQNVRGQLIKLPTVDSVPSNPWQVYAPALLPLSEAGILHLEAPRSSLKGVCTGTYLEGGRGGGGEGGGH